jgi:hypothetical protein
VSVWPDASESSLAPQQEHYYIPSASPTEDLDLGHNLSITIALIWRLSWVDSISICLGCGPLCVLRFAHSSPKKAHVAHSTVRKQRVVCLGCLGVTVMQAAESTK